MLLNMSDAEPLKAARKNPPGGKKEDDGEPSDGPNLVLLYSLIALALAVAIGLALLIVLPFYQRR
jgi:hypothetical protein